MLIQGMLGLGDTIHQRAVVRQIMEREEVWLQTPWPGVFHDMVGPRLHLTTRVSSLRTQTKNIAREAGKFNRAKAPRVSEPHKIWYKHDDIISRGGFLAAMCHNSGVQVGDFALPIPESWRAKAAALLPAELDKPLMVYRPLVSRTEWNGCDQRNPDAAAYVELLGSIRDRFFIVSVADLAQGKEWAVSKPVGADLEYHNGELDFETLAGMVSLADLTWCSPGFMLVLSQALSVPMVAVFGGHESARMYDHGNSSDLFIQPKTPCECLSKTHACDKRIDMSAANAAIQKFTQGME
jgi:hypothetical protein